MGHLPVTMLKRWKDTGVAKNEEAAQELWLVKAAFCISLGSLKVQTLRLGVGSSGKGTWCGVASEFLVGGQTETSWRGAPEAAGFNLL